MARSLDQIISELNSTYDPQVATLRQRQEAIPGQVATEESGLQAKQNQAFGDITNAARRRGLGFSGIPLSEQAQYTSTEFLPSLARLRQSGQERATSLEDSINQILERRNTFAQQLQQGEIDREQQQRQFDQQLAASKAAAAAAAPTFGSFGDPSTAPANSSSAKIQKSNNGYSFADASGRPITAAQYAQLTGRGFRELLSLMAKDGDRNAQVALKYVGNDGKFGSAPQNVAGALTALGATGSYATNKPAAPRSTVSALPVSPMLSNSFNSVRLR